MKLVIIEPLGVEKEKLLAIAGEYVSDRVEIIYYDTKVMDTATLIERGKDADIIVVSNLPMNGEVIRGCDKLKLLSVAFTGVDHIDLSACREKGVTVILITHNSAIAPMADRVIHIKNGKVSKILKNDHPVPVETIEW